MSPSLHPVVTVRDFLRRKAHWIGPLAGAMTVLGALVLFRSGLGWVDETSDRDHARAELAIARAGLIEIETCVLDGPRSPGEWLEYIIWHEYRPGNPATRLRKCQERVGTERDSDKLAPHSAAWALANRKSTPPESACDYLVRVEERLAVLVERAQESPIPRPARPSCTPKEWPEIDQLLEPEVPAIDPADERILLTDYGLDEHARLRARFAYQRLAYGVRLREQMLAVRHENAWHFLAEPLDTALTHWSERGAAAITRGVPQALWIPEEGASSAALGATRSQPSAPNIPWKRTAYLPDRVLAKTLDMATPPAPPPAPALDPNRAPAPAPAPVLVLIGVHGDSRQWLAFFGDPQTGALDQPIPLTPPLIHDTDPATAAPATPRSARQSPAQRAGLGQYCVPAIPQTGHAMLACITHTDDTSQVLVRVLSRHAPEPREDTFHIPLALDAEVLDVCVSGPSIWLATRLGTLITSADGGHTFRVHSLPRLGQGNARCTATTWSWLGELAPDPSPDKPESDTQESAFHHLLCHIDTGCHAPRPVAGPEVDRAHLSRDGTTILLVSRTRGALLLHTGITDRERAPPRALRPLTHAHIPSRVGKRQRLAWLLGGHLFVE